MLDSEAMLAIADESSIENLLVARAGAPALRHIVAVGGAAGRGSADWQTCLLGRHAPITPVATLSDDPAVLIYTSGTTGAPKGALIPQRALIGNLSGFASPYLIGWIRETTNSTDLGVYALAMMLVAGALLVLFRVPGQSACISQEDRRDC